MLGFGFSLAAYGAGVLPRVWLCWLASWLLVELLRVWHLLRLWLYRIGFGKGWSGVTDLQQDAVAVAFLGYA